MGIRKKVSAVLSIGKFIFPQTGGKCFQTFQHFQKFLRLPQKIFSRPLFSFWWRGFPGFLTTRSQFPPCRKVLWATGNTKFQEFFKELLGPPHHFRLSRVSRLSKTWQHSDPSFPLKISSVTFLSKIFLYKSRNFLLLLFASFREEERQLFRGTIQMLH